VRKPPKSEIAVYLKDWQGKDVYLDKQTIRDHISLFHVDELLVVETLKAQFSRPLEVRFNAAARTENAIYDIPCNGHQHLVVAIEKRPPWHVRLINTYYACSVDRLPKGKLI